MAKRVREQASKRARAVQNGNTEMRDGFIELRKGSRTSPHRNLTKYDRKDYRRDAQRGIYS